MKQTFTLLFLFILSSSFAQIQKLREFSAGSFVDSRIIYEDNKDDVFGYFLLYEFDRKSREVYDMEYVVMDKNLNKITSGTFTEGVYKNFMIKTGARLSFVKKKKNQLYFGIHDNLDNEYFMQTQVTSDYFRERYRKINLDNFTLSKTFFIQDNEIAEMETSAGDTFSVKEMKENQSLIPINDGKFVLFSPSTYKIPFIQSGNKDYHSLIKAGVKSFSVLDENLKVIWTSEINADKKDAGVYRVRSSDNSTLVLEKKNLNKTVTELSSYEIYSLESGKLMGKVTEEDPNYRMSQFKMEIDGDYLVIYNYLYEPKDKVFTHEKTLGYARLIIDKKTGKELKRNYLLWENLNSHFTFKDKFGNIPKYGKILFQNFIPLKNGNTIGIAEGYKTASNTEILDFYVMEFDPEMKVKYFKKTEKMQNIIKGQKISGQRLQRYGAFDYYFSQKLDEDGNYVILYANNEKEGGKIKRKRDPSWVLGIVTYVDGEFEYDKLNLTTTDGMIVPIKAKNGSILLQEYSEKNGAEMRLEKINY
ncbi:hypothetical protein EI546_13385 [Aequorivita sp. H23M31]|uniref:WG repeat-containing protein n=1 Tax=Aequorivita ciconiae TaxID=2494375 RepID=A0A410G5V6_9FLAO|nr:DUF6770 family protein [Aequorivita sp. H23M31]QAA82649.1 hypothetical protein EI546_13385 [Aequorivita sp. H23M31]